MANQCDLEETRHLAMQRLQQLCQSREGWDWEHFNGPLGTLIHDESGFRVDGWTHFVNITVNGVGVESHHKGFALEFLSKWGNEEDERFDAE